MQKQTMDLSIREARALAVIASRLAYKPTIRPVPAEALMAMIRHIGMVQLDTISVVTRAHETALFSRLGPYDLSLWQQLFSRGLITEYLAHAAAIVPVSDLPLMQGMMRRVREQPDRWDGDPKLMRLAGEVLERIRQEGPLGSRDFEGPPPERQAAWQSWYGPKLERRVLSSLWAGGELLISQRDRAFTRWYELSGRIITAEQMAAVREADCGETLARKSLLALGVTNASWLCDYYRTGGRRYLSHADAGQMLKRLSAAGACLPVHIPGVSGPCYLSTEYLETLSALRQGARWPTHTTLLSPFDNLIFTRRRMKELFGMDYTIEIYTPAEKRSYGYYTMPILHRGELVGRLDPSLNRRAGLLTIKGLHLEPTAKPTKALASALSKTLSSFAGFVGAKAWTVTKAEPESLLNKMPQDQQLS